MSQLLNRTSLIIDALAESELALSVHAIAKLTELPVPTCGRILQDLVRLGWADQSRPRGPYRIGPRIQLLADRHPYRWRLIDAARPLITHLSRELGQLIVLAGIRGTRRQILCMRQPDGDEQRDLEENDDLVSTVGGRILLAHLPPAQLRRMLAALELPNPKRWRGLMSEREIRDELALYRRQGFAAIRRRGRRSLAIAFRSPDGDLVSLGTNAPSAQFHPDSDQILTKLGQDIRMACDREGLRTYQPE